MGKKKKSKQKNKKLNKQLKALTKELRASRKKEAALVNAVEQLTQEVTTLQQQISDLPVTEKEPQSIRRGTTPRGRRGAAKTKVSSTKQSRKGAAKAKKKKAPTTKLAAAPAGAEPTKVARETPPPRKKKTRRGRPRTQSIVEGDDLTAIKGLGVSIDKLLREAGITTYRELAQLPPSRFREILQDAGRRYKNKDPQPWIEAAAKLAI